MLQSYNRNTVNKFMKSVDNATVSRGRMCFYFSIISYPVFNVLLYIPEGLLPSWQLPLPKHFFSLYLAFIEISCVWINAVDIKPYLCLYNKFYSKSNRYIRYFGSGHSVDSLLAMFTHPLGAHMHFYAKIYNISSGSSCGHKLSDRFIYYNNQFIWSGIAWTSNVYHISM